MSLQLDPSSTRRGCCGIYPVSSRWCAFALLFTGLFIVATIITLDPRATVGLKQSSFSLPDEVVSPSHNNRSILQNVICVGDSITRGNIHQNYPKTLQRLLRRDNRVSSMDNGVDLSYGVNVSNFGVDGKTARNGYASYRATNNYLLALKAMENIWVNDSDITVEGGGGGSGAAGNRSQVGVLVLMLGTNDSKDEVWNGTAQYVKDMVEIATSLIKQVFVPQSNNRCQERAKRRLVVILMIPPPICMPPLLPPYRRRRHNEKKNIDNTSLYIKGQYKYNHSARYLLQPMRRVSNEVREGVREVAKLLQNTFGVSSTGYSQQNSSSKEKCLSSSADVRVTVEVVDLFTLFLNAMIKTATEHGQLSTVERTSANYYGLDADSVMYWLWDGMHIRDRGNDLIAKVLYESIKKSEVISN